MKNKNKLKLGLDISKIHHIISRKMDASVISAIDDNLTVSQAYVIDFISNEGKDKEIFQKDLEKAFDLKRSSISLMLNNMEKSDLIERVPVTEDARLKKIILTQKSIKLYEKISTAIDSIEDKLSENITPEEIKVFQSVLDKIRNSLE
ncbi:MarR family transcriptional regulator [Romboutsia sp. MSSM.1001216sp_RTP31141st1_G3_RTP31141_220114]|uniref:MarR family winged helix-turn-helix transcriptional regulator n=1 Tax=unclassified Romboutsia TaxID=2626894 RepID=UPI0031B5FFE6